MPRVHEALDSITRTSSSSGVVAYAYNFSTQETEFEAGGSEAQSHPWLPIYLEAILGYMKSKKERKEEKKRQGEEAS